MRAGYAGRSGGGHWAVGRRGKGQGCCWRGSDGEEEGDWSEAIGMGKTYLELMLTSLSLRRRVQEIDC